MTYHIDFSSVAKAEADAAFLILSQFTTGERAQTWYQGLINAIVSLQKMPQRCPIAREDAFFTQEIRQILYRQGKQTYRILFTVLEDQTIPTVRFLHIRHAAQKTIGEPEVED